jgi:hypothetical protein
LGQFTVHEWMNELILRNMSEESKKNMTSVKHTAIELTSGVVAGIAAATLSQVGLFLIHTDSSLRIPCCHKSTRAKVGKAREW